jgi:hypothetical protein
VTKFFSKFVMNLQASMNSLFLFVLYHKLIHNARTHLDYFPSFTELGHLPPWYENRNARRARCVKLGISIHGQSIGIGGVWEFDLDREAAGAPGRSGAGLTENGGFVIFIMGSLGVWRRRAGRPVRWDLSTGYPQVIHI